ncbi:MAG: ABC transporter ATP-binding protein [Clostridia bacterium]|nr:ABC transporter ATP-binding protein [Clostridia bacterium]
MADRHLLEIKNLVTTFRSDGKEFNAIEGVNMHVDRGEIVGIVGESGSGKSVTMLSSLQLIASPGRVAGGEVYLEGVPDNLLSYDSDSEQMRQVRGGRISMIFQEPMTSLNPVLTVGYQIQENILLHKKVSPEEAKKRTIEAMKMVNIPDAETRYDYYPQQFSGGMRQRIMIAMAMAPGPDILIADEATTALDVTTQAQLLEMIRDIAKKTNTAVIMVTHNLGLVARYAERIYVMYGGHIMETSDCKQIFHNTKHPYTRALLRAIPRLDDPKDRVLIPIDGLPPVPSQRPVWCPFYARCEYRCDACKDNTDYSLKEVCPGHWSSCILNQQQLDEKEEELRHKDYGASPERKAHTELCLDVKDVRKYFPVYKGILRKKVGEVKAIEDISFTLRQGETLGVVGESGCGKTTLARCIQRMYEPDEGQIVFGGRDIAHLKDKDLKPVRPRISMIFQDPFSSLDPRQSAGSIVGESLLIHKITKSRAEYEQRIDELFRKVGMDPAMKDRVAHEFSGGQRQRIGIARALSSNPDLIICDEPISALDVSIQAQIINLLEDIQAEMGISYIFIAHDLAVVKHISDRILVMYLGRVMEIATCDELYEKPLHPYTQALLSAIPVADPVVEEQREAVTIQGEVPSILKRPSGCPFHNRCPRATERCKQETPKLHTVDGEHQVACHLF